ncbi:antiviral reverse transcriptase Drt3a [Rhizobium leguminosarum]|uniref:antiviral reverse transcriptase Drt3a n=1 Tax=Rhizobium leguminosarum TaxID=384 RepID=UPI003F973327
MYDFSFSSKSLNREFTTSDFAEMQALTDPAFRSQILGFAEGFAETGFDTLLLEKNNVKGRDLYQYGSLAKELTLRKLSRNIKVLTKVTQSNRDDIIKSLIALLGEGEDFDVFKIDIKNFYPSLDRSYIDSRLRSDNRFPPTSYSVWQSFSRSLASQNISGLPPGLSLSATLSEYAMREFDRQISKLPGVYYFARYVDDMVILAVGQNDHAAFLRTVADHLPLGLQLNQKKTKTVPMRGKSNPPSLDGSFDFLGYQLSVTTKYRDSDKKMVRRVDVDIAEKKISRLKSRIVLSLLEFINGGSYQDLEDRLRLITGNYHIYDHAQSFRRNVGIYYNYNQISRDKAVGLTRLDAFLRGILLARNGNICTRLYPILVPAQRRRLLKYSFSTSFRNRTHYHFNSDRLTRLIECWKYE